ncbi:MAG: NADH-quinone oxidoreductase subunit N [Bdellovibrionales bacterium]
MEQTVSFRWFDVLQLMPVICLVLASVIPLAIKVLTGNKEQNSFATLCYGLVGLVAAGGWLVAMGGTKNVAFEGALVFDGLSTLAGLLIVFVTGMALIYARENFSTNNHQFSEFVFLLLNSAAGMLLVSWSNDLIFFFVGLEMMSLCLYVLIAMSSEERLSKEAAFKYFLLGSFASAILLYGIAFVFGTSGTTSIPALAEQANQLMATNRLFMVGLVFLILGLCFKVSIFPLHAWTPDVYQGAPTPVTAFMATGAKTATFVLFLRVMTTDALAGEQAERFVDVLQWLAAFTILAGNIAAVMQNNLKRMLAYSSIAHSGYIMVGLVVAALGGTDPLGGSSVVFYLVAYSLMTVGAFGILSIFEKDEDASLKVEDLKGLAKRRPWLALCLTLFLLSMAGIPPTIGFFGKFFIFSAAVKAGLVWLAIWGVFGSVIGVYYYLRPIVYMYMADEEGAEVAEERYLSMGLVSIAAVLVVLLGIFSSPVYKAVLNAL